MTPLSHRAREILLALVAADGWRTPAALGVGPCRLLRVLADGLVERRPARPVRRPSRDPRRPGHAWEYRVTDAGWARLALPLRKRRPVTEDVIDSLRALGGTATTRELAEHTGRTPDLVRRALTREGLVPVVRRPVSVWRAP